MGRSRGDGEDGEDKLLGIDAFPLIFKIFWKLENSSINWGLFHIINTPKFSRNSQLFIILKAKPSKLAIMIKTIFKSVP